MKTRGKQKVRRVHSLAGTNIRVESRIAHMPAARGEFARYHYVRPGSRNCRKIGRG